MPFKMLSHPDQRFQLYVGEKRYYKDRAAPSPCLRETLDIDEEKG
jgi:hypothetical protein